MSKLCNILFTYELADRLKGTGVTANCLHPGVITTKMLALGFDTTGASVEEGAATAVYLASLPELENTTGKYFIRKTVASSSASSRDAELGRKLWEASERMTQLEVR